jgi:hypothetical protein
MRSKVSRVPSNVNLTDADALIQPNVEDAPGVGSGALFALLDSESKCDISSRWHIGN